MHSETDEDAAKAARLAAFDALMVRLDAGRMEERHGTGRLFGKSGRPRRAEGCLLPDGTATDATVVALPGSAHRGGLGLAFGDVDDEDGQGGNVGASNTTWRIDPEACVWSRRLSPDGAMARRGRLTVEPGMALRFVDAPGAGEEQDKNENDHSPRAPSLERDLTASPGVIRRIPSDLFARLLYAALCNTEWRHRGTGTLWSISWRGAGGVVADLRGEGNYMDWYCSGGEGLVDEGVLAEIEGLGWDLVPEGSAVAEDAESPPAAGTSGDAA